MSGKFNSKNKKAVKRKAENRKTENIKKEEIKTEKKSEVSAEEYGRRTQYMRRKAKKPWHKKRKCRIAMFGLVLAAVLVIVCAIIYAFRRDEPKTPGSTNANVSNVSEEETLKIGEVFLSSETVPETTTAATSPDENTVKEANKILKSMTLEEKINQLFFITPEALTNVGTVIAAGEQSKTALEQHPVGGIIYFSPNFTSESQAKEMIYNMKKYGTEVCKVPLFIGIDEEGGSIARLGNSKTINVPKVQTMPQIGATGDVSKAYQAGSTIGSYLKSYGFNVDFAPVADVLTNNLNQVVKDRSFGTDAGVVSGMAVQFSKGLNDNGILSCYKHFPGHGATKDDTHEGFAYTDKTYDELAANELRPFVEAINNNADIIMVGHFSLPNVTGDNTCASISPVIINDILKTRLGYKGLVITDSLAMGALTNLYQSDEIAVRAINAGVDILLMPQDFQLAYNGVINAVKSGKISEERIDQSVLKIIEKKLQL